MSTTPAFDIVRAAHIEFNVTDLERSREFYVKTLGLIETETTSKQLYLRGVEDRFHHCLVLTESNKPSVGHLSFRVRSENDLDSLASFLDKRLLRYTWLKSGSVEKGQGRALRLHGSFGVPGGIFLRDGGSRVALAEFRSSSGSADHENRSLQLVRTQRFGSYPLVRTRFRLPAHRVHGNGGRNPTTLGDVVKTKAHRA